MLYSYINNTNYFIIMEEQSQITTSNPDIIPCISSPSADSQEPQQIDEHSLQEDQQQRFQWCDNILRWFSFNDARNDIWTCLIVTLPFWFFASVVMILGFYGSFDLQLSPNCSFLIETNSFFVHSIKAHQIDDQRAGPVLFGFHEVPELYVETTWSRNHVAYVDPKFTKNWAYYLNLGSQIDVSYNVEFPSFASLFLVVIQGRKSLYEWIHTPSYPNSTVSWNVVYGSGKIAHEIKESDTYFVAVGNSNLETAKINLNITIKSLLYNTSKANFKCLIRNRVCSFNLFLLKPNVALVTSPGPAQVKTDDDNWYIQVSFGPQWITYFIGSCIFLALILALFRYYVPFESNIRNELVGPTQGGGIEANREPLISPKNYYSILGSSYESIPSDGDEGSEEEKIMEGSLNGGETNGDKTRRLCAICFDGPSDCFFLPCGHCVACFNCGSRIFKEAGTCPICRKKMKKVRKIISV